MNARKIDFELAVEICLRILDGEYQHDIAADYGFNQGRISEINTGQKFPGAMAVARMRRRRRRLH